MGMFDLAGAASAKVRETGSFLRSGIHTVKYVGLEKVDDFSAFDLVFEDANGATHKERFFEPKSAERQPNRFNSSLEDPSQAEQFTTKIMHVVQALAPDYYQKIVENPAKFSAPNFDKFTEMIQKLLEKSVGMEVQIKLLPNGRYVGFPGFPTRIDKNGNLYLSTSFIGHDLTLSAWEKGQIDKANAAKPTNMASSDQSELDDVKSALDAFNDSDDSNYDPDGLPF